MPCVALASCYNLGFNILVVVDGQVEGLGPLAARLKLGDVFVHAACGIGRTMPCVALAGGDDLGLHFNVVVYRQVESLCFGATSLKLGDMCVGAAGGVCCAVPLVALAGVNAHRSHGLVVDYRQLQCLCLGAASLKVGHVCVGAACGVGLSVPWVALACGDDLRVEHLVLQERQVQRHDAVAAAGGLGKLGHAAEHHLLARQYAARVSQSNTVAAGLGRSHDIRCLGSFCTAVCQAEVVNDNGTLSCAVVVAECNPYRLSCVCAKVERELGVGGVIDGDVVH